VQINGLAINVGTDLLANDNFEDKTVVKVVENGDSDLSDEVVRELGENSGMGWLTDLGRE
jgi:hypothetical protein